MKTEKEKKDSKDLSESPIGEVFECFKQLVADHARLTFIAMQERSTARRKQRWAAVAATAQSLAPYEVELLSRLGVVVDARHNPEAFRWLAVSKAGRFCEQCAATGGFRGRTLNWITEDGVPLLLMQAHNGADIPTLKESLQECRLLCMRCAKKRGVQFTRLGRPILTDRESAA